MEKINQMDDHLLSRTVTNIGENTVFIEPDFSMTEYLSRMGQRHIQRTILKPGESKFFKHFYVVISSDDKNQCMLKQEFKS